MGGPRWCLLVLGLLLRSAAAQEVEDARSVAAEASARHATAETIARFIRLLVAEPRAPEEDARPWLLDALIRADADVPARILEPLFDTYPDQVVVLLAKDPAANREAMLRLTDGEAAPLHRMAIAAVLAGARQPGVASRLLDGLVVTCMVSVLPSPNMAIGVGGGAGGPPPAPVVRAHRVLRPGWPPFVRYTLTDKPQRGDVLVGGGTYRIYYRREEIRGDGVDLLVFPPCIDDASLRLGCVADLLPGGPREVRLQPVTQWTLYWSDAETYLKEVAERRARLAVFHAALVGALVRRGLLTEQERKGLKLRVAWKITDHRRENEPLPAIPDE